MEIHFVFTFGVSLLEFNSLTQLKYIAEQQEIGRESPSANGEPPKTPNQANQQTRDNFQLLHKKIKTGKKSEELQ